MGPSRPTSVPRAQMLSLLWLSDYRLLWGAGTITLRDGIDKPLRLANIPSVELVHEALVDQVEVNQILAHRDSQSQGSGSVDF